MDETDELILEDYTWDAYTFTPALFKLQVEACLLTQVVVRSKDDRINQDYSQLQKCSDLLASDDEFRQLLLRCWKIGSFGEIRRSAILRSIPGSIQSDAGSSFPTVVHNASTFTEVHGDMYNINYCPAGINRAVQEWYCQIDYRAIQKDLYSQKSEGTGEWFFKSKGMDLWLSKESKRILWCPGMPGVGKTVISSMLIRYLEELRKGPVCFVYLNYKRRSEQSLSHIFATILRQLYESFAPALQLLEDFYGVHFKYAHPTLSELAGAVKVASQMADVVYMVLDGLDEYLEHYSDDTIITLRDALMAIPNLKMMVTSRVVGGMMQIFQGGDVVQQEINTSPSDIEKYLKIRISSEIPGRMRYAVEDRILEHVTQAAKQRFLLAKLHMDLIVSRLTVGEIRQTLKNLSEEVNHVYSQAVQRIDQQGRRHREIARLVLMWATCVQRNLTVQELQHALAAAPEDEDIRDYLYSEELLTSVCAGLIVINQGAGVVQFVHYTAQEFFEKGRKEYFPDADFKIATACLNYLLIDPRKYDGPSWGWTAVDRLPLFSYIKEHLGFHLNEANDIIPSIPDEIEINGLRLLVTARCGSHISLRLWSMLEWKVAHFAASLDLVSVFDGIISQGGDWKSYEPLTGFTPFACAIIAGSRRVIKYLLSLDEQLAIERVDSGDSMLSLATLRGHTDVIDILFSKQDVDANSKNNIGQTPLHLAVMYDQFAVFHQLISNPMVDVNAEDQAKETPLFLAVRYRHSTMTNTLLKDPRVVHNSTNIRGLTPLAVAIAEGATHMVDILLEHDSLAMDFRDKSGRSHLSWAADNGMIKVVETILSFPTCPVDAPDNDGRTPISYAAGNGHEAVVDLLLRTGQVNPDSRDSDGFTPLYFAIRDGHTSVALTLLATGRVDADSPNNDGRTRLSIAAEFGRTAIARRLLEEGVDISARDKHGRTPLSYAAASSHHPIIRILLDAGAKVDESDDEGRTPLSHAAASWQAEMIGIETLLNADADIDSEDKQGFTPLTWAIVKGKPHMATFLLEDGAKADQRDHKGRFPLWHAAKNFGFSEDVSRLLKYTRRDLNAHDTTTGRTPLIVAAEHAQHQNVKVLLDAGADVDTQDLKGRTALHHAAGQGPDGGAMYRSSWSYTTVAEMLLAGGAGVNVEDIEGRTPLEYAQKSGMVSLLEKSGAVNGRRKG